MAETTATLPAPEVAEGDEADMARTFLWGFEELQKHSELVDP